MGTDDFHNVSTVYGLDSQILAKCFKAFASYLDVPKKYLEETTEKCPLCKDLEETTCTLCILRPI
jgi:hypothetical protein